MTETLKQVCARYAAAKYEWGTLDCLSLGNDVLRALGVAHDLRPAWARVAHDRALAVAIRDHGSTRAAYESLFGAVPGMRRAAPDETRWPGDFGLTPEDSMFFLDCREVWGHHYHGSLFGVVDDRNVMRVFSGAGFVIASKFDVRWTLRPPPDPA